MIFFLGTKQAIQNVIDNSQTFISWQNTQIDNLYSDLYDSLKFETVLIQIYFMIKGK